MSVLIGQLVTKTSTLYTVGNALRAGTLLAYLSLAELRQAYGAELPKTVQAVTVRRYEMNVLPGMANYWAPDVEQVKRTRTATTATLGRVALEVAG